MKSIFPREGRINLFVLDEESSHNNFQGLSFYLNCNCWRHFHKKILFFFKEIQKSSFFLLSSTLVKGLRKVDYFSYATVPFQPRNDIFRFGSFLWCWTWRRSKQSDFYWTFPVWVDFWEWVLNGLGNLFFLWVRFIKS